MAASKMTFKAMYLVSEDTLKDMQKKAAGVETSVTPAAPSFPPQISPPPPSPLSSPSTTPAIPTTLPPPPTPTPQTLPDGDDDMADTLADDDLNTWVPPDSEPENLIDRIDGDGDNNDGDTSVEDRADTPSTGGGHSGGETSKAPKKGKVQSEPLMTKAMKISDIRKKKFLCSLCNAEFKNKTDLGSHVRTVHKGKKAFVCRMCKNPKTFETEGSLNRHIKEAHFSSQVWEGGKRPNPNAAILKRKRMQSDPRDDVTKIETTQKRIKTDNGQGEDIDELLKCKECHKIFDDFRDFNQHITTAHNQPKGRDFM